MASLLLVVFLVELVVQLVNTIGAVTINHMLWRIFLCVPTSLAREFRDQRTKQTEYLAVRRELRATSGQDQFAKWARLDRQHNKFLEELQRKKTSLDASRARFDSYLTTTRLICTRGLQWFLPFWYSRQPMFWLPYGLFPYYVEWFASFPRAPMGSVSIVVWQWACTGVLALVMEAVVGAFGLAAGLAQWQRRRRSGRQGRVAQAIPAAAAAAAAAGGRGGEGRGGGGRGETEAEAKKTL